MKIGGFSSIWVHPSDKSLWKYMVCSFRNLFYILCCSCALQKKKEIHFFLQSFKFSWWKTYS